ncbi:MAG: heavy metal-associated domain-containing protein [Clostridia bacterium]
MQSKDVIIIIILIAIIGFALYKTWLQLSGKKTCCGGTKEKIKPKKLKTTLGTMTVHIEGMHCDSCKNSVTKALNAMDGVSAKVNLSKKIAEVSFDHEVSKDEIKNAIEKRGFKVTSID